MDSRLRGNDESECRRPANFRDAFTSVRAFDAPQQKFCYFAAMAKLRIIKKYPNRRLYDTEISSYITLEEVRQLVLDGETFEVRDAKSGEDLTRSVLLQIIAEHEEHGQPMLSPQLLSHIIRSYGYSLQ